MKQPQNRAEWQSAVDAAAGLRALADCQMYGLITGVQVDVGRCDELLEQGRRLGMLPSKPAGELAVELARAVYAEHKEPNAKPPKSV